VTGDGAGGVGVVVLNWNGAADTVECVRSLTAHCPDAAVLVVDNGSTDDSLDRLHRELPGVEVLALWKNTGYTGGNNAGVAHLLERGTEIVCVLNNDTVLSSDALTTLAQAASAADVAVSPVIEYEPRQERPWFSGGVLDRSRGCVWPRHGQAGELAPYLDGIRECELLTGCCIVATAEVWRRVGLFDERFFLNFEDSEWSVRAQRKGVRLQVVSRASIGHKVSRSFTGAARSLGTYYYLRNALLFNSLLEPRSRWATSAWLLHHTLPAAARDVRHGREPAWRLMVLAVLHHLSGQYGRAGSAVERRVSLRRR
jgi:GT2 family glycosyltransferase